MGCVSQDVEPPASAAISRKGTKVLGPIRRVRFTRATLRQANIRENKGPSLNEIQVKLHHQRSPCAVKFEGRRQEKTERQERCACGKAWNLAKNIYKLKEKEKATFFSPTDEWSLPAASTKKGGGKRVCGGFWREHAHGQQERPHPAELETVRVSKNPRTVVTANSEVLTKEELCEDHGYNYHWTWQMDKNAARRTTYRSLSLVLSTGSSSSATFTSPTSSSQEAVIPTSHRASTARMVRRIYGDSCG